MVQNVAVSGVSELEQSKFLIDCKICGFFGIGLD